MFRWLRTAKCSSERVPFDTYQRAEATAQWQFRNRGLTLRILLCDECGKYHLIEDK